MNTIVVYPSTKSQTSVLEALLSEMKIRFSVQKTKKKDDSLMTKEEYFSMLDKRIESVKKGNVHRLTPDVEMKLFGSVL